MKEKKGNKLLEGSITKSIFTISIPIIFANVLQTVYQLIDTFWVGRIGTSAVAAVSLSFPLLFFITSLAMGLAVAGSILVAQYNGRNDKEKVSFITGQTFSVITIFAIVLGILGAIFSRSIMSLFTNDFVVLNQATIYLRYSFIAILGMFVYNIFQGSLRGVGEVKLPMRIILGTVILNFFLDPLLMFGWKFIPSMGISGVALATVITEYLSAIIGVFILLRGKHGIKMRLVDLKLKKYWGKKILKLGLPTSIENSSRALGYVILTFVASLFGTVVVAAYGIGMRILTFAIIPALGFSFAATTLVGNSLGAGNKKRAEKTGRVIVWISFLVLEIFGILVFFFAKQIAGFFVPGEIELITETTMFLRIIALFFGFAGVELAVMGVLRAAGKTISAMVLALIQAVPLFALSFLLSKTFGMGAMGLWVAFPIANSLALIAALYIYWRKKWLKKNLIEEPLMPEVRDNL